MQNQAKRVVVNTVILYAKIIISLIISVATTRIILSSLGVEDFGLYNLVAGLVSMLSFVNTAMTTSTLRYNAYYLGKPEARIIFGNSILLHIILAVILFAFLEIAGMFFINDLLNVEESQTSIVKVIFQFVIIGCVLHILTVPFDSLINAHQDMLAFSIIAIVENLLKLLGACLLFFVEKDKVVFYSLYISLVPFFTLLAKSYYCKKHYPEASNISFKINDKDKFKEMTKFAFWNMFGAFSNAAKNQGIAMVLNVFYGVVVNAAYGISQQINHLCLMLSGSLQKSLNPIILKTEGDGKHSSTIKYALAQCRISMFLVSVLIIPIYYNLPYILELWLGEVPLYTIDLCRWLILLTIFMQMTTGVQVAIQSVGKIKIYQMTMATLILLNIPFSILFLSKGYSPDIVFKIAICVELVCIIVRILFARKLLSMKISQYIMFPFVWTGVKPS